KVIRVAGALFRKKSRALIKDLLSEVDRDEVPELTEELVRLLKLSGQKIEIPGPTGKPWCLEAATVAAGSLWHKIVDTEPFNLYVAPLLDAPETLRETIKALRKAAADAGLGRTDVVQQIIRELGTRSPRRRQIPPSIKDTLNRRSDVAKREIAL